MDPSQQVAHVLVDRRPLAREGREGGESGVELLAVDSGVLGEVGLQLGVRLPDGAVDLGHVALEAAEAALGHERLEVVEHHGALRRPGKHLERDGRQGEPDAEDDQRDEHIPPHP